ncbi:phosphate ABC transporter permease PstA [Aureimonas jatrophae]|uniref:Phosphate transport system permease protein PstA n=1 Tax=Aureimonas jatrophae TaxID=1166073 RepID=A0A1H0IG44_9HYPH|nr:phosphate ABC transporter permease PstA [Aureimonas jatrophae]MBB3952134.1 phosphate transport system permease protein [Aureimonas jatrophae]SDO30011.1 phosphate ABC transporter membrane protein 2, PhoT family [Aureimonas jatrophae]
MSDATFPDRPGAAAPAALDRSVARRDIGLKRRYAAERRFKLYGLLAILTGLVFLAILLWTVVSQGYTAFWQTEIRLPITFSQSVIDPKNTGGKDLAALRIANYPRLVQDAIAQKLGIDPSNRAQLRAANELVSQGVRTQLAGIVMNDVTTIGTTQEIWVPANSTVDSAVKGQFDLSIPEDRRPIKDQQLQWIRQLEASGDLQQRFNTGLFTFGASSRAETAGLGVAIVGSLYMMGIVLVLALPIGVAASIYLEEFAPKNRFTDLIEVNINNLAAVPSIVYGLLGLAVFVNWFGLPRSAALVGGLVLTLMTLPTIIIATRAALKAVPPSIRAAALGLGASKTQMVFHHVLPLAMPGILTGTIIGLAHALGETAPLLLIGMVAFVADYPPTPLAPSTALPVQIYMWANEAERAFVERTSGAIIVLLLFLAVMNIAAILLRRKFERRW